jgi:hypothetical protein
MRRNDAALAPGSSQRGSILVSNLPAESISLQPTGEGDWGRVRLSGLEYQSCKWTIRSITSDAAMNHRFGPTNLPMPNLRCLKMPSETMSLRVAVKNITTTLIRYGRRMPGFEGLSSSYRNSS